MRSIKLSLLSLVMALGGSCLVQAQTNGIDLTVAGARMVFGSPCDGYSSTPYLPFVLAGVHYTFTVHAAPNTAYLVVIGPPPTLPLSIPGFAGELVVHSPVLLFTQGLTGPMLLSSPCGQGQASTVVRMPVGPPAGADFGMQAVGWSSTTGVVSFSRPQWITYK